MSEPTNPLFEEEKAFLERKKLEYERALRGDVAQLKEQTAHVGRVTLVGAGLAGSLWLITKAFGGRKRRRHTDWSADDDSFDYRSQHFADFDFDEEGEEQQADGDWQDPDSYFGSSDAEASQGAVYHSDTDRYESPAAPGDDLDDNGLHDYPDFPAHSASHHGSDTSAAEAESFQSEAYGHPDSNLPFDDSRRLPESEEFSDENEAIDQYPGQGPTAKHKRSFGASLIAFAKSDLGKVVVGQAASVAIALVTKAIKDKLPSDSSETPKSSDLADLTGKNDGYAHGHPATPQPDAQHAPADAPAYREPLA